MQEVRKAEQKSWLADVGQPLTDAALAPAPETPEQVAWGLPQQQLATAFGRRRAGL